MEDERDVLMDDRSVLQHILHSLSIIFVKITVDFGQKD